MFKLMDNYHICIKSLPLMRFAETQKGDKLEIVFMKHYAPNHLLAHEGCVLIAILLIILNQLTKYEASIQVSNG